MKIKSAIILKFRKKKKNSLEADKDFKPVFFFSQLSAKLVIGYYLKHFCMKAIKVLLFAILAVGPIFLVKSGQVTCYSESRVKSGATYYDCGNCTQSFNSRAVGLASSCNTSPEIGG